MHVGLFDKLHKPYSN